MITFVIAGDDLPPRFDDLKNKPNELFIRGDQACLAMPSVAIVGSRNCSHYGSETARNWAYALAAEGIVVVSGLAIGIDGAAHRGALEAKGRTVAVLGCGVESPYPTRHVALAEEIAENGGAVASEYPPGTQPIPWRLAARNRLIAAADVTLLVEARADSGTLITADFALGMGRTLLVVPGDVREGTAGSNGLLRERKAHAVLSPEDVLGWLDSLHLRSEYAS